jgi:Branched-chain amino acid transport protein (AzlD)
VNLGLLVVIAAITYGSRVAGAALLPRPRGRAEHILSRMPAPIFASLAVLSLINADRTLVAPSVWTAALGALVTAPRRSMAFALVGGLAGYVVGRAIFGGS